MTETAYRRARVSCHALHAGIIEETDTGYRFTYDPEYLTLPDARPISLTLPLSASPFESRTFFPFFDGLIPEGWLLDLEGRDRPPLPVFLSLADQKNGTAENH